MPESELLKSHKAHCKYIVSLLDLFNGRLTLDDILYKEVWFIDDLFIAQTEYLEEKRKAEAEMTKLAKKEAATKYSSKKRK